MSYEVDHLSTLGVDTAYRCVVAVCVLLMPRRIPIYIYIPYCL